MKKILRLMALAVLGLGACAEQPQPLKIDNALTPAEIEAGLLTPEILWKMGRAGSASLSPDGSKLLYAVTRYNLAENCGRTQIYVRDMASGEVSELTDLCSENNSPAWSADGRTIRFLSDRSGSMQVWEMNPEGGDLRQLSRLDADIEGFGISPRGDKAWYVRRVQVCDRKSSDVYKDMPHSKARIYDDLMSRHWDYWDEGWYRHIFVADFDGDRIAEGADILGADAAYDAPLAPYFDMAEIAWNHAGTMLAYTCKPLAGTDYALTTDSDVFVYDVASGLTQNICKPRNFGLEGAPVINPGAMPGYDKYPVWSPDDLRIAFRSMRQPGFESDKQRLFLYDCRTGELEDLTPEFDYNALNVVWENDDTLWFAAPIEATHQLCRLHLPDGRVEVVTRGDHDIKTFTMAGGRLVAELCTISSAAEYYEVNPADGALTKISDINGDIYGHIRMGEVQKRWVPTTDGKRMLVWVILPPDFDPAKKYPTLLYCEGGPQNVVSQFWSYRWNFQLMAARGYVVVAPNRRGLPSFGQEWLEQISGDYSGQNIRDYLAAIDDVAGEPWADEAHMGCVGASYGGYSVYYLAGNHEGRFKAFISHCGIFDFEAMYGQTEELFFLNHDYGGPYWDRTNAVAQRSYAHSPHRFVEKWDTPIMVITGEYDFRIPYTQSLEAFTAARLHGIPSRLVDFEDEGHQVLKPQNSLVWNREFFGWLDRYLKPAEK
mgnify:FL=1